MPGTRRSIGWINVLVVACALLAAAPGAAADTAPADAPAGAATPFQPPVPDPDGFDWIKLVSGEWLKGQLLRMRDHELEFDSDKLDEVDFDWEDVHEIRTSRAHTYVFTHRLALTGVGLVRRDTVTIATEAGVVEMPRSELLGIVSGTPRELDFWSGKLSLGITALSGNTDQTDLSSSGEITRESAFSSFSLKYNGAISVIDGTQNANNHRFNSQAGVFFSRRIYVVPLALEYFRDEFQNINHRVTPSALVGYQLIDTPKAEWEVEGGVGYQWTRFTSVQTFGSDTDDTAALIFRTSADVDITKDLEWEGEYKLQLGVPDVDQTNHHLRTVLSYDLFWNIDLDVTFVWDRNESPRTDDQNVTPEKNDYRLSLGFGLDF